MTILHYNNNYEVHVIDSDNLDDFNYHVINKFTGKVEMMSDVLPQAIMACEEFNSFLELHEKASSEKESAEIIDFTVKH